MSPIRQPFASVPANAPVARHFAQAQRQSPPPVYKPVPNPIQRALGSAAPRNTPYPPPVYRPVAHTLLARLAMGQSTAPSRIPSGRDCIADQTGRPATVRASPCRCSAKNGSPSRFTACKEYSALRQLAANPGVSAWRNLAAGDPTLGGLFAPTEVAVVVPHNQARNHPSGGASEFEHPIAGAALRASGTAHNYRVQEFTIQTPRTPLIARLSAALAGESVRLAAAVPPGIGLPPWEPLSRLVLMQQCETPPSSR